MCVVKNIDVFSFDAAADVLSDIFDAVDEKMASERDDARVNGYGAARGGLGSCFVRRPYPSEQLLHGQ